MEKLGYEKNGELQGTSRLFKPMIIRANWLKNSSKENIR